MVKRWEKPTDSYQQLPKNLGLKSATNPDGMQNNPMFTGLFPRVLVIAKLLMQRTILSFYGKIGLINKLLIIWYML